MPAIAKGTLIVMRTVTGRTQLPLKQTLVEVYSTTLVLMSLNAKGTLTVMLMWMERMRLDSSKISVAHHLATPVLPVWQEIGAFIRKKAGAAAITPFYQVTG
jgi:hypothetical protein